MIKNSISSERVNDIVLKIITDYIRSDKMKTYSIAEFGAGSGALSIELREVLDKSNVQYEIDCYDIEPDQINSKKLGFSCNYFDAQQKFNILKKYDIIIAVEIIEHIENPFHFIREIAHITHSNSLLVLTTPNVLSLSSRFRYFASGCYDYFRRPYNEYWLNMGHLNPINPLQLIYLLRKNGFSISGIYSNKAILFSKLLLIFVPLLFVYSYFHFVLREKGSEQKKRNIKLMKCIFSWPMLTGKIIIFNMLRKKEIIANENIWHTSDSNFKK